jgi:hypothetical protein
MASKKGARLHVDLVLEPGRGEYSRTNSDVVSRIGCPQARAGRKAVESATKRARFGQLSTPVESHVEVRKIPAKRADWRVRTRREILIECGG